MDNQFLEPLFQMEKAKPSKDLYKKIETKLFANKIIPIQTLTLVAASILLLLFVNIYTIRNSVGNNASESANFDTEQLINDFQIY